MRSESRTAGWRRFPVWPVLFALHALGSATLAHGAQGWEFGEYQPFAPSTSTVPEVTTRAIGPAVRVSRVAVQRPQVAPGGSTSLIAEYQVSGSEAVEVKEIRVIRFEGQHVATLEKVVSLSRGKAGSSVKLNVPGDAAPGFYTVTTTVGPASPVVTRSASTSAGTDRASTVFRVDRAASSPAPAAPFKLWTDKPSLKVGETVKLSFQSDRDGYVTLVNVGTSGKITILYPNAYAPNHAVKARQVYAVPGPGDPYELTLNGPEGIELVYALFTVAPTRFAEAYLTRGAAFAPVNEQAEVITRDINVTVKKTSLKDRATAVLELEVTR